MSKWFWASGRFGAEGTVRIELATRSFAPSVPWYSLRVLLGTFERELGAERFRALLKTQRVHLSTILPGLRPSLSEVEEGERAKQAGELLGLTPISGPVKVGYMATAAASAVAACIGSAPVALLVASAHELDCESWGLLIPLLQELENVTLVVGTDPEHVLPTHVQRRVNTVGLWELSVLRAVRHLAVEEVAIEVEANESSAAEPMRCSYDTTREDDAFARVRNPEPLTQAERGEVMEVAERAFDAMGFPFVVQLAQAMQEVHPKEVPTRLVLLAGSAAYNLCTFAEQAPADDPLHRYWCECFRALLPVLDGGADRVFVSYRYALWQANHGELEQARQLLESAAREADALHPRHVLHRAYAHMGLAYVWFRLGDAASAEVHCQAVLDIVTQPHPQAPTIDVGHAHFNALVNLSRLAYVRGDRAEARRYMERAHLRLDEIPARKPFFSWFDVEIFLDDMASAAADLDARYQAMKPYWSETITAPYAFWSGDLFYRLGDARRAFENFRTAAELWAHFHHDASEVFFAQLNCAVAAFRANQHLEAQQRFQRARGAVADDDAGFAVELDAAIALTHAHLGNEGACRESIAAVRGSLPAAEVDGQVRALRAIGDAFAQLGDREAALESYSAGHELCSGEEVPEEDVLGIVLGLADVLDGGELREAAVKRAFALAPHSLHDASAWWDMPRVAALLATSEGMLVAREVCDVQSLVQQISQRCDCARLLGAAHTEAREHLAASSAGA